MLSKQFHYITLDRFCQYYYYKFTNESEVMSLSLAKNLSRIRRDRDLTQQELAKKAKVSLSTVGRTENGTLEPSIRVVGVFAKILDCTVDELLK